MNLCFQTVTNLESTFLAVIKKSIIALLEILGTSLSVKFLSVLMDGREMLASIRVGTSSLIFILL